MIDIAVMCWFVLFVGSLALDVKGFVSYMKDKLLFIDDKGRYYQTIAEDVFHWLLMGFTMMLLVQLILDKFGSMNNER